jgi:RND superfamily putative drug exporter
MFFRLLGRIACRAWPFVLVAWIALVIGLSRAAPPWDEVAQDREFAFLPADSPSRQANEIYSKAFPTDRPASNIVIVFQRTEGGGPDLERDQRFIDDTVEPGLRQIAAEEGGLASQPAPSEEPLFGTESTPKQPPAKRSIIDRIRTPTSPNGGAFLVSEDRRALLVVVELTTDFLSDANQPTIKKIENLVRDLRQQGKVPEGLEIAVTGSAVVGRDHTLAQLQSVRATQTLTFVLVIGLLVVIYRAPLVALIPLLTVYVAVQTAISILSILAGQGHLMLFQGIQIYITILAYGAGVDYSLFLTARYREHLEAGDSPAAAVAAAVSGVGPALAASAAAVIAGIFMMYFARFGKFREAGLAIPLSLFLVLCATLSLSPALLRLAGRFAFWPQHPRPRTPRRPSQGRPGLSAPTGSKGCGIASGNCCCVAPARFGWPQSRSWHPSQSSQRFPTTD